MTDIASLGIRINTADVKAAVTELDKLADTGKSVEDANKRIGSSFANAAKKIASDTGSIVSELKALNASQASSASINAKLADALAAVSAALAGTVSNSRAAAAAITEESTAAASAAPAVNALATANTNLASSAKANEAALLSQNAAISSSARSVSGLAAATTALRATTSQPYQSYGFGALGAQAKTAAAETDKLTNSTAKLGAGQKLTSFQAQQLSFQLNDLFVQIASGQSPITALIQQGSQLNGTFGGFTGTFRAIASVFTVARVAIGGIAAVIGGTALAFAAGRQESADFAKSIALTGNAAGITEGQFNSLAKTISATTQTTIGSTRETLQALTSSGKFSGDTLKIAAAAAQNFAKVTGTANEDVLKTFVSLTGGVARGAAEMNSQYNFLTATQLQYIKTLEDQGDSQRALQVTFEALNQRLGVASTNLGTLERAWGGVKNAASAAIDAMLEIGRVRTPDDAVKSIEAQLKSLDERRSNNPTVTAARKAALTEQLALEKAKVEQVEKAASASAKAVEAEKNKTAFLALQEKALTKAEQRAKEIAKANAIADKAGATDADRKKVIDSINERFKDPAAPKGRKAPDTTREDARALLLLQIEDIKSAGRAMADAYTNSDRILEARRAAGLQDEKTYYFEKKLLVGLNVQLKIDELEQENALLAKQKLNTKDGLDRDREVKKNQTEIAKLRASSATQLEVLSIQEESALKQISRAYEDARIAAQSFYDATNRARDSELAGLGQGSKSRDYTSALNQIREKYEQQRQDLQRDNRNGKFAGRESDYQRELELINEFQDKSLASYTDYYARLSATQQSYSLGVSEALQNYVSESRDVYKQTEELATNAFKGIEDALVTFVTTGKLSFKDLANSVVADITRIIVKQQIANALSSAIGGSNGATGIIGSIFGAFAGTPVTGDYNALAALSGQRAIGGAVSAGGAYQVNERGPEMLNVGGKQILLMGNQNGNIDPSPQAGAQVNQTLNFYPQGEVTRKTQGQIAAVTGAAAQRAMMRNL